MPDNAMVIKLRREIGRAPICTPILGEYVGDCHWSRTGWAIYREDGACTCRPALPPSNQITPTVDQGTEA